MKLFDVFFELLTIIFMIIMLYTVFYTISKQYMKGQKSYTNNWKYYCYICFFIGLILAIFGLSVYLGGPKIIGEQTIECTYSTDNITINDRQFVNLFICKNKPMSDYLNV